MRDGGIIKLYSLENVADPGRMPQDKLVFADAQFCSKVTTGVTRHYAAEGANKSYSCVVMLHNIATLPNGVKYAVDEDGVQYRIDYESPMYDRDVLELTLVRLEDFYDVAT